MLTCPTCNSSTISIVTVVESKKKPSGFLDALQIIGITVAIFTFLIAVMTLFNASEAMLDAIFEFGSVAGALAIGGELGLSLLVFYGSLGIMKWSFITFVVSTALKALLPSVTTSHEKCICHLCHSQWKYIPYAMQNPPIQN
jgi:hypothetical protein